MDIITQHYRAARMGEHHYHNHRAMAVVGTHRVSPRPGRGNTGTWAKDIGTLTGIHASSVPPRTFPK